MSKESTRRNEPRASRPDMPGYGVVDEKGGKGLMPWSWALKRLSNARSYFISTVRTDGRPHVMPIWGVWIEDAFYFSTGKNSVKHRNLQENPNCVLCPGDADKAVVLEGKAKEVRGRVTLKKFAEVYLEKYDWDVSTMDEPVYAIRPSVAFGQIEKEFTKSATRWRFGTRRVK